MNSHNEQITNTHRTDKIKLLQTNPDEYFKDKLRVDFGTPNSTNRTPAGVNQGSGQPKFHISFPVKS
ncbi:MAG TPA: hypothetical protein DHV38_07580 [Corynebacterium casei]|nr:hypothetical protein [Corynebacterium casei]